MLWMLLQMFLVSVTHCKSRSPLKGRPGYADPTYSQGFPSPATGITLSSRTTSSSQSGSTSC